MSFAVIFWSTLAGTVGAKASFKTIYQSQRNRPSYQSESGLKGEGLKDTR